MVSSFDSRFGIPEIFRIQDEPGFISPQSEQPGTNLGDSHPVCELSQSADVVGICPESYADVMPGLSDFLQKRVFQTWNITPIFNEDLWIDFINDIPAPIGFLII